MRNRTNSVVLVPLAVAAIAAWVGGCSSASVTTPPPKDPPADPIAKDAPKKNVATTLDQEGLSAAALDKTANPCQDFFAFACGGWEKATQIPDDKARWVRSFSEIDERNEQDLKNILEKAAKDKANKDPMVVKLGGFYGSCMDEPAIEKAGLAPLKGLLAEVKKVKDKKSLEKTIAELHKRGVWVFFDIASGQDFKNATKVIANVDQNGLGLPDRDYYTKTDDASKKLRETYRAHVEKMLTLAGRSAKDAKAAADDVLRIETTIASAQKTREERRDPQTMYNRLDRPGLTKAMPTFPWEDYFQDIGFAQISEVSVTAPKYLESLEVVFAKEKPVALQSYLTWHVIHQGAPFLPKAFLDEDFKLTQLLTGQKVIRPRFKRCIDATDTYLGELLAQPFVDLRFGGDAKSAAETYALQIAKAFEARVGELDWMSAETKKKALEKLSTTAYLIGYPAKWKSYEFNVGASYGDNALAGAVFKFKDNLTKIGKPVDRGSWEMTPPTVNAYYDPLKNQMVFPAGILQPPFYSAKASIPVNLGAMGMVVGHELTHGFDDEGSQFDKDGNLASWWAPSDAETFKKKGECVARQYSEYEVLPGLKLNGKLTLGENIADVGGIKLAFRAYRSMRKDAPETRVADGFTEDQQFFLATGQLWCAKYREEESKRLAAIDPHSHPRYRVNGPLSQLPEFATAFSCKPEDKMVSKEICSVW